MGGLNHEIGEIVEGMDDVFTVVPFDKWAEQTRLTAVVEEKVPLKRPRKVERPVIAVAKQHAKTAFKNSGLSGWRFRRSNILVQLYPRTNCICFIFHERINGEDRFVTAPFKLGDEQIRDLTLRGLWTPYRLN